MVFIDVIKISILYGDILFKVKFYPDNKPLPKYYIFWDRLEDWATYIAIIQNRYLKSRNNTQPRDINSTILILQNIIISNLATKLPSDKEIMNALAWDAINLGELYQLFRDGSVTEAFCSEIDNYIVITHRQYGRCITNIVFTEQMWNALKIRAEYDSGKSLNALTPALKLSFSTHLGNLRISLQTPPLTPQSPSFNIRRLPSKPLKLETLVEQKQISSKYANFLTNMLLQRKNIIIAGEPGSGKTTLANALLLKIKPSWRIIVMEDARELTFNIEDFPMITRFYMPAVGDDNRFSKRASEIARLLHRSPDYVFLGELQNAQDTTVAFEGFAAGIRGMATTHARDIHGLISRWIDSHKLQKGLLNNIDIIVFLKRELVGGKIKLGTSAIYRLEGDKYNMVELDE